MGYVLIAICIEDLRAWWNSQCTTYFIVPIFMRCQLSWPDAIILSYIFIHYGDLFYYMLYRDDHMWHMSIIPIHGHCTLMYSGLLHVYLQSHARIYHCIVPMSGLLFNLGLHYSTYRMDIMYFGHHVTPLTSHIKGYLLSHFTTLGRWRL